MENQPPAFYPNISTMTRSVNHNPPPSLPPDLNTSQVLSSPTSGLSDASGRVNLAETQLGWLLQRNRTRKSDPNFQQLRTCVKQVRKEMPITGKSDPRFGIAVQEAINRYNQMRWHGNTAINSMDAKQCAAVGIIFERNLRNAKHRSKKRLAAKNQAINPDQSNESGGDKENIQPNKTVGVELESSDDEETVEEPARRPILAKNDLVLLTDGEKTAVCAGEVINPFGLGAGDVINYEEVEIKILQPITGNLLIGDVTTESVANIVLIPKNRESFAFDLLPSKAFECQRGSDCRLEVNSLVLLDLGENYAENWPLIGKVKAYNRSTDKITVAWLWLQGEDDGKEAHERRFDFWMRDGEPIEESFAGCKHYFCRFQLLQDGRLPLSAKLALASQLEKNDEL